MKRGITTVLLLVAGVWAFGAPDGHAQVNPFRRMIGQEVQTVERSLWFERADGRGGFIFDRSAGRSLILPDDAGEVMAVARAPAAGGGEIWVTDTSRVLLRRSNLGGWTYFPADRPDGVIVEPVGQAQALAAEPVASEQLQEAATDLANRLARLSRTDVSIEVTSLSPVQNAYIVDAMTMVLIGADLAPRRALRDLEVVRIGVGEAPQVRFDGRTLDLSVQPEAQYGGRPSSARIRQAIERYGY